MEIQQNQVQMNDGGLWLNKGDDPKVSRFKGLNVISHFIMPWNGNKLIQKDEENL